jgi:hypothetical protein
MARDERTLLTPTRSAPTPQTINNLIEKSPQNWHTTVGLPFRRIEGTVRLPYGQNS